MAGQLLRDYPDALVRLGELDEWMALGFYEALEQPWPRAYGRAYRRLYEQMHIRVPETGWLVPAEPFALLRAACPARGHWDVLGAIVDFQYFNGLRANAEAAASKRAQFPHHAGFIDALLADLAGAFPRFGDSTHNCPDAGRVLAEGFDAMEAELLGELAAVRDERERDLLEALADYTAGVRAFHSRAVDALSEAAATAAEPRRSELVLLRDSFRDCFLTPATTFLQGLLAVHFTWLLDGCDNIGRLDQLLGALYDQDLANGTLDREFARRLLDELFVNVERLNGYNLQVGGATPSGEDGFNALSQELLLACRRNHLARPNVAFRITRETPDDALRTALDALSDGSGRPALYNDDLYIESLLSANLGLTPEDARDFGFGGCTETMIPGRSNIGCTCFHSRFFPGIDLNLVKALEYALHDGRDPVTGCQVGPHTGELAEFDDFEALLRALRRQLQYVIDVFCADLGHDYRQRFAQGDPKLYRTFLTRDCVARHKTYEAGGARYNWTIISLVGIGNLTDSLAALRTCVFDQPRLSRERLLAALAANFDGYETERRLLLGAPKFGNDNPAVDEVGASIVEYACHEMRSQPHPRGGRFLPGCIMFNHWGGDGAYVGATPDGRLAGTVLSDSVGPVQGRDTHGPTAMLRSVAKLPLHLAPGTPVTNMRFQREFLTSRAGQDACVHLIRSFFALGGMQLQIAVADTAALLAAQADPASHGDLIVRVGGYSDYFTSLGRALQDAIIARTEHGAG